MKKQDYSLLITILRGVAALFGVIAFVLIFFNQLERDGGHFALDSGEILCGLQGYKGSAFPLIGYILCALGALASVFLIFGKKLLNDEKLIKILDFAVGGALILGGVLVVLTLCWFALANSNQADIIFDTLHLRAGPIVACVFASLAGVINVGVGLVEGKF